MADFIDSNRPLLPPLDEVLPKIDHFGPEAGADNGRVDDLLAQIRLLDEEVLRGRELLEQERLRQATQAAATRLELDTRLDDLRREELSRTQAVHESYRALLNERQLEYEAALSTSVAEAAKQLEQEQRRHEAILTQERVRQSKQDDADHRRSLTRLADLHKRATLDLRNELEQTTASIAPLKQALADASQRADRAEAESAELAVRLQAVEARLQQLSGSSTQEHQARVAELERRAEVAEERLAAERRRAAATLAEVLAQSAVVAAEADSLRPTLAAELEENRNRSDAEIAHVRRDYAAQTEQARRSLEADRERIQSELATALQEADNAYQKLASGADEQAGIFLQREAELEALIGDLRRRLADKTGPAIAT